MNNQQESPFGNPKFLTSIILVFLLLSGWQYYIGKKYPAKSATTVAAPDTQNKKEVAVQNLSDQQQSKLTSTDLVVNQQQEATSEKSFEYEDDQIRWVFSSLGMGFSRIELKKYTDRHAKQITFESLDHIFSMMADQKRIFFDVTVNGPNEYSGQAMVDGKKISRKITYNAEKQYFESVTTFDPGFSTLAYNFSEKKHVPESKSFLLPSFEKQDFLFQEADKVKSEHISSVKDGEGFSKTVSNTSLASIGTQYFTQAVIDKSDITPATKMSVANGSAAMQFEYDLKNAQVKEIRQKFYVGPKSTKILDQIDPQLNEVMDYGMFGFISRPLLVLMNLLHQVLGNWGLAIIALTIVVRLVMLPFSVLSFKSSRAMQKIQPQLQAIREKYKNDPLQVNRETMALMKEHKANPISGCLPMLIQIPIFFALWRSIGSSIEIYQQPFFGWITDLSAHDSFFVLPILMGITMFFQQKLTPTTMDPAQAKILNFMPIIFSVFMLSLPSGLTLYNFISALFGVTQQYFLLKDKSATVKT